MRGSPFSIVELCGHEEKLFFYESIAYGFFFFFFTDATHYAHYVFNTIKHNQTGKISFEVSRKKKIKNCDECSLGDESFYAEEMKFLYPHTMTLCLEDSIVFGNRGKMAIRQNEHTGKMMQAIQPCNSFYTATFHIFMVFNALIYTSLNDL